MGDHDGHPLTAVVALLRRIEKCLVRFYRCALALLPGERKIKMKCLSDEITERLVTAQDKELIVLHFHDAHRNGIEVPVDGTVRAVIDSRIIEVGHADGRIVEGFEGIFTADADTGIISVNDDIERDGSAVIETLYPVTSDLGQEAQVLFGLDPFRHSSDAELHSHLHKLGQNDMVFLGAVEIRQEFHIKLNHVKIEFLQHIEG